MLSNNYAYIIFYSNDFSTGESAISSSIHTQTQYMYVRKN